MASGANRCDAAKARHLVNHAYGERLAVKLYGLRVWHAQKIAGSTAQRFALLALEFVMLKALILNIALEAEAMYRHIS